MIQLDEYLEYLRDFAVRYIPISHTDAKPRFVAMGLEEAVNATRSGMDMRNLCMVAEPPTSVIGSSSDDNTLELAECAVMLLRTCKHGDFDAIRRADQDAKAAAFALMAKMRYDRQQGLRMLQGLNLDGAELEPLGQFLESGYGMRLTWRISSRADAALRHNPDSYHPQPHTP